MILEHAEVMIHQPLGGISGQAADIVIAAEHIKKTKALLNKILSENTGKDIKVIGRDTDRDNYMDATQAIELENHGHNRLVIFAGYGGMDIIRFEV